jgi:hypothetical protein
MSCLKFKMFACRNFLTGVFLLSLATPGFSEPCAPSRVFSNVLDFDRIANGQIVSLHDCDRDGLADYQSFWTVVEFAAGPVACQDPYDSRHLVVPRSGYYRILAEPARVEVLLKNKERFVKPSGISSYRMRDIR